MSLTLLMDLRRYLTVQHHVPGRIRLKFSPELLADPHAMELKTQTDRHALPPCIRDTKINLFTRNIIIEYDPAELPPKKLHEVLITQDSKRFHALADELKELLVA